MAETRSRLLESGIGVASSTPEQFAAQIRNETAMWGKIMKEKDIKAE